MKRARTFDVNRFNDSGFVHRVEVNGEWREMARRVKPRPFATVQAHDLGAALNEARRRYGREIVASERGAS